MHFFYLSHTCYYVLTILTFLILSPQYLTKSVKYEAPPPLHSVELSEHIKYSCPVLFKVQFNIIVPPIPRFPNRFLLFRFPDENCTCIFSLSHTCYYVLTILTFLILSSQYLTKSVKYEAPHLQFGEGLTNVCFYAWATV